MNIEIEKIGAEYELVDSDGDTKVEVEQSPDEDVVRITTAGTEVVTIDNTDTLFTNKVSINAIDTMTVNGTSVDSAFAVHSEGDGSSAEIEMHRHNDTSTAGATIYGARSRGTETAQTVVQSGDHLMTIAAVGYDGTDYSLSSRIDFGVDATPGNNDMPGNIVFKTSEDGTQNTVEKIRISSDGIVVNDTSQDYDFRIEGSGNEYGVYYEATNNNLFVNGSERINVYAGGSSFAADVKLLVRRDDSDTSVNMGSIAHSDSVGRGGIHFGGKSRGTESTPTAVQTSDTLFSFAALGHDGTNFVLGGTIDAIVDDTVSTNIVPTRWLFSTQETTGGLPSEKLRIEADGIVVNDGSSAFKYRIESTGDEYGFYNDGTNDTFSMGTSTTSITVNSLTVRPKLLVDRGGGDSNINFVNLSNLDSSSAGAFMVGARARGYSTSPTTYQAVQNGDRGLVFRSDMHDGTQFITTGNFQFLVDGTVSTGIVPTTMQVSVTDNAGNLFLHTEFDSLGDMHLNPPGGSDITFFKDGGIRANRNQNSAATADMIYSSANYVNHFRIDVSQDETNIGNNVQGTLVSFEGSTLTARFNRTNAGANIVVESSSPGVDLWQTDTTNNLIDHNGGLRMKTTRVTSSPYTVGVSEYAIYVDTDSAAITVNLPAGVDGQTYKIINVGSSGNNVTLTPNGAELLQGTAGSATITDGNYLLITYQSTEGWW